MKRLLPLAALSAATLFALVRCGSPAESAGVSDAGHGSSSGSSSGGKPVKKDAGTPGTSSSSSSSGSSSGGSSGSSSGAIDDDSGPSNEDAGPAPCKRGIASTNAPGSAFLGSGSSPGVTWWYDWSNQAAAGSISGFDFVPMIWGNGALAGPIPFGSHYLLGFNEPNFANQSDMSPVQAAQNWPAIEALAQAQGIPIVSPGVNFCGSAADPSNCADQNITDPYTFLRDFFNACSGCEVDYIAVHWYNCDLPSLQGYIDGNDTLQGFVQFGKPIWLTEFCCDNSHPPSEQQAYMQAAIPYLENNPHVYRYSWFSAGAIPNAVLTNSDGSPNDLGQAYLNLPQNCPGQ